MSGIAPAFSKIKQATTNLRDSLNTILRYAPDKKLMDVLTDPASSSFLSLITDGEITKTKAIDFNDPDFLLAVSIRELHRNNKLPILDLFLNSEEQPENIEAALLDASIKTPAAVTPKAPTSTRPKKESNNIPIVCEGSENMSHIKPSSKPVHANVMVRARNTEGTEDQVPLPPLPPIPNPVILERVFTHSSFVNNINIPEDVKLAKHNERLEFLGDSFLNFITALICYELFPDYSEGQLSFLKSKITSNKTILKWAKEYNFDQQLRKNFSDQIADIGDGKIYSDVFEAYMGAIVEYYIMETRDGKTDMDNVVKGYLYAKEWIESLAANNIYDAKTKAKSVLDIDKNAKQELHLMIDPCYKPNYHTASHDSKFVSCIRIADKILGYGIGDKKKDSESRAAMDAIKNPYSFQFFTEPLRIKYESQMPQDYKNGKQLDCIVSTHPFVPPDYLETLSESLAREEAGLPLNKIPNSIVEGLGDSVGKKLQFILKDGTKIIGKRVLLDAAELNMNSRNTVYAMFAKNFAKAEYNTMELESGEFLTELIYVDDKVGARKVVACGLDNRKQVSQQKAAQMYLMRIQKKEQRQTLEYELED